MLRTIDNPAPMTSDSSVTIRRTKCSLHWMWVFSACGEFTALVRHTEPPEEKEKMNMDSKQRQAPICETPVYILPDRTSPFLAGDQQRFYSCIYYSVSGFKNSRELSVTPGEAAQVYLESTGNPEKDAVPQSWWWEGVWVAPFLVSVSFFVFHFSHRKRALHIPCPTKKETLKPVHKLAGTSLVSPLRIVMFDVDQNSAFPLTQRRELHK